MAPVRCPGCDLIHPDAVQAFCGACLPLLERAPESLRPPGEAAAVFVYGGPLADAIRRVKYGRRLDLVAPLSDLCASVAPAYAGRIDRVVPLPLHPVRLRERGFNQVTPLAARLARTLGAALDVGALQRTRPTRAQAGLEAGPRISNVRGAFRARLRGCADRVLLVDDVRTSGATLAAAAGALRVAGYREVHTLALCVATWTPNAAEIRRGPGG